MTTPSTYRANSGYYGAYNRCTVICSPDLVYPDVYYDRIDVKQSN